MVSHHIHSVIIFKCRSVKHKFAAEIFNKITPILFEKEYSKSPSSLDVYAINMLHQRVHDVNGMLGLLGCMHTYWKNCPVAWQQSFQGKEAGPTIVLEATADHNLWFCFPFTNLI
jgi:Plant transposon protein